MSEDFTDTDIELVADQLTGDITSFLIDRLRQNEVAYRYMTENDQRQVIQDATRAAVHLVQETVKLIASHGKTTVKARLKKFNGTGDKIQLTYECPSSEEYRHELFDAVGTECHIVIADPLQFVGGEPPKPTPDQPDLPVN